MSELFRIEHRDPETFRRQTRRSSMIVVATFALFGMAIPALLVGLFGGAGEGGNFGLNLVGVLLAAAITAILVRTVFLKQSWMDAAAYGWRLKRSLMRVTNQMHQVKDGVKAGDESAMLLLRFYHLGLQEMHHLDGNTSEMLELVAEREQLREALAARGVSEEQLALRSEWLEHVAGSGKN
ncbi:DUF3087 family protein [Halopseudomonas oceani]|uniref:DUF3087 domain-containing protein n=2 Tax=Halopseudomonas oceani TaxID=1708783 RepID=A0A2P4ETS1_9GAMM|nr:DUF3087 family protein [Halopseudomonas oceani]POB02696.1 DUF3087 domain-containing protein [Halopseudomonas oceani]